VSARLIGYARSETGQSIGHAAIGVVEDVGSRVTNVKKGEYREMTTARRSRSW
jgi:D-arabinose 1-dehydrogenase-like Zn-dependent alcohol dehydrogenase